MMKTGQPQVSRINTMRGETVHEIQPTVLTIGRSTRTLDTFIEMLRAYGVKHLADAECLQTGNPELV
jgi:hypothetical protein